MPIFLDGKEYADETALEAATNPAIPESLKRVYITGEEGKDSTASTMPLQGSTEPADALNPSQATTLPVEFSNAPEPPKGLEPLIGDGGEFSKGLSFVNKLADKWVNPEKTERPPAKVLFTTKSGVEFTDHDIEDAINVGMSAGPASIVGKFDYYINSFIKQAESKLKSKPIEIPENFGKTKLEPMPVPVPEPKPQMPMDETEKAIKAIMDVLDGPGAYEAKYGKTGYVPTPVVPKKLAEEYHQILETKGVQAATAFENKLGQNLNSKDFESYISHQLDIHTKKEQPWSAPVQKTLPADTPGTPEFNKKYGYDEFEQIPFGYTDGTWTKLTKAEKDYILDNPPSFGSAPKSVSAEASSLRNLDGIEASKKFHDIYNKEGSTKAIQFAHKYEEHATYDNWIKYEDHVNDAGNHPTSKAFDHSPPAPKSEWPLTVQETAEIYHGYIEAGNQQAATKLYANFLKDSKPGQLDAFDAHVYKLDDAKIEGLSATPKTDKAMAEIEQFLVKEAENEAKASKLSKLDKVANKLQEVYNEHLNKEIHERAKFHSDRAKGLLTKEALDAGYDTPAFRGLKNRGDIMSTHKYDKTGVMYSSDSPLLADMYADYLSKHPGWNVKEGAFSEGATVAPLVINTKDYHVFDAKGQDWQLANNKAMQEARERGSVGVIVKNVWDEPNSTRALGKPNTVYITFPKGASTVKSRFAEKFDPDSKNMLHMVPVLAVGGAAGYVSKEIQED